METKLRRSSRLKKLSTIRAKPEPQHRQAPRAHKPSTQPPITPPTLLTLPSELRILIFSHLPPTKRPFLIGRSQEDLRRRKTEGSPRDAHALPQGIPRNERRNRPKQPPITRVCRTFRHEALPLWYAANRFWLIHNEFAADDEDEDPSNQRRGFDDWLSQTPREMFDFMEHVSLCGYAAWPNRVMITLDLKSRRVVSTRHYSTYGDEIPIDRENGIESTTRDALASKAGEDGFAALMAVLAVTDGMFRISKFYVSAPPGRQRGKKPLSGWEYDW